MTNHIETENSGLRDAGPDDLRVERTEASRRGRIGGRVGIERLVLILIALASFLSLISFHFHLTVRNHDDFFIKQVIPSTGLQGWLGTQFGYSPSAYDRKTRATLGSPYHPEYDAEDSFVLDSTGSDYLGIWYYTREIISGRNPYANSKGIQFLSRGQGDYPIYQWAIELDEPGIPHQYVGSLSYPPMGPLMILPFYLPNYFASFALYLIALHFFLCWLAYLLIKKSPGHRLPITLLAIIMFLTSYPLGFLVDRGNIEGAVFILVASGVIAYARGLHLTSAVLLGLAASGKVVPAIFFALFLLDGRFKPLLVSVITMCVSTLVAMYFMHEPLGILSNQILSHMDEAKHLVVTSRISSRFDHSLFSLLKSSLFLYFPKDRSTHLAGRLSPIYSMVILASTALILLMLRRVSFTNRVLVLTVLMLSFPQMSADYKLIHLYLPFGMILLGAVRRGWASSTELATLLILIVVFSPKSYQFGEFTFGFVVNASLLAALILIGLRARFGAGSAGGPGLDALPS